uniref:GRF-type domain-containing protein n=1 Tax=Triticum urartu TaxID=4572 RepID=A0A8R7VF80_TRIUA
MVSWGDGEESSEDHSNATSEGLKTLYDSDWEGLADGAAPPRCKCGAIAAKFVGWEGYETGRKFLGCAGQFGERCDYVKWVDGDWPSSLQKAIGKLWEMYGEAKQGRVSDALYCMEEKFKFRDEITKLHRDLKIVQEEVNKTVNEKQITLALKAKAEQALIDARAELEEKKKLDAAASNMHKVLRIKAEKDRDKIKEEKRKLELMIADLVKQKEGTRVKLRKIKELCDE